VTRTRLFLETMENVLGGSNKVIVETGANGQGVIPYLPLPELDARRARQAATQGGSN
jgi:modulator of FtsH protease HflK